MDEYKPLLGNMNTISLSPNNNLYEELCLDIQELIQINIKTAKYYEQLNYYIYIPSISITALSSVSSFISSSELLNSESRAWASITAGILTIIATSIQSVASACQYKSKSDMFRITADRYEQILTKIKFKKF